MQAKGIFSVLFLIIVLSQMAMAQDSETQLCKIKTRQEGAFLSVLVTDSNYQPIPYQIVNLNFNGKNFQGKTSVAGFVMFSLENKLPGAYVFVNGQGYECRRHIALQSLQQKLAFDQQPEMFSIAAGFAVFSNIELATMIKLVCAIFISAIAMLIGAKRIIEKRKSKTKPGLSEVIKWKNYQAIL